MSRLVQDNLHKDRHNGNGHRPEPIEHKDQHTAIAHRALQELPNHGHGKERGGKGNSDQGADTQAHQGAQQLLYIEFTFHHNNFSYLLPGS